MKIKELIKKLEECNPNADIDFCAHGVIYGDADLLDIDIDDCDDEVVINIFKKRN